MLSALVEDECFQASVSFSGPTFRVRLPGASPHPINIGPLPILHRPQEKAGINLDLNKLFSLFKEKDKKVVLMFVFVHDGLKFFKGGCRMYVRPPSFFHDGLTFECFKLEG